MDPGVGPVDRAPDLPHLVQAGRAHRDLHGPEEPHRAAGLVGLEVPHIERELGLQYGVVRRDVVGLSHYRAACCKKKVKNEERKHFLGKKNQIGTNLRLGLMILI